MSKEEVVIPKGVYIEMTPKVFQDRINEAVRERTEEIFKELDSISWNTQTLNARNIYRNVKWQFLEGGGK